MNDAQLASYRAQIDDLDRQIVALLAQRTEVVRQLMVLKTDEKAVRDPARVEQVLAKIRTLAQASGMEPEIAVQTYRTLIAALVAMQLRHLEARRHAGTTP